MIKTNFTITFFESEICFKINAKFIFITNTQLVTFLDLCFLVALKTEAKKVLSAGIFNGCLRFFLPDEGHYCRINDHPVESVLHPSCWLPRIQLSCFLKEGLFFIVYFIGIYWPIVIFIQICGVCTFCAPFLTNSMVWNLKNGRILVHSTLCREIGKGEAVLLQSIMQLN